MRMVRSLLAAAALLVLVLGAFRVALPETTTPDLPVLVNVDGSYLDRDGTQNGLCEFAICGQARILRHCERSEVPIAQFRVRLTSRGRCSGRKARTVDGAKIEFACSPGPSLSTTTTLPGPCGTTIDAHPGIGQLTLTCIDGWRKVCPTEPRCDLDHRANGACVFGFFCSELCVGVEKQCIRGRGYVRVPPFERVVVPVGQRRTIQRGSLRSLTVTTYTLRCVRHP